MFKKIISLFIITAVIITAFAACGSGNEETTIDTNPYFNPGPTQGSTENTDYTNAEPTPTYETTTYYGQFCTDDEHNHNQNIYETTTYWGQFCTHHTTGAVTEIIERPDEHKVVISCGENEVTPYLVLSYTDILGGGTVVVGDGPMMFGYPEAEPQKFAEDAKNFPTLTCTSIDDIKVFVNGEEKENAEITIIDENGKEIEYAGNGTYYAYVYVKFFGDILMVNGEKSFEESSVYGAFFIIEVK